MSSTLGQQAPETNWVVSIRTYGIDFETLSLSRETTVSVINLEIKRADDSILGLYAIAGDFDAEDFRTSLCFQGQTRQFNNLDDWAEPFHQSFKAFQNLLEVLKTTAGYTMRFESGEDQHALAFSSQFQLAAARSERLESVLREVFQGFPEVDSEIRLTEKKAQRFDEFFQTLTSGLQTAIAVTPEVKVSQFIEDVTNALRNSATLMQIAKSGFDLKMSELPLYVEAACNRPTQKQSRI